MTHLFWLSLTALLYIYVGYPALAWALARLFGRAPRAADLTPSVTLLIPAFNEDAHIEAKLRNSLALDYPKDRLRIVVASDGSTDATNAIVERFRARGVALLAMRDHLGKAPMLSRTVPLLHGEIIVFSDASSELEPQALRRLLRPFADSRVGCVSGLYRVKPTGDLRGAGEGLYWRYETFLKQQESALHSILGAHGAFYAIRASLFQRLADTSVNDDYLIPMRIVAQGFRAVYEPSAVCWEAESPVSMRGEFSRRRRIAVGNCQQIVELAHLLNPLRGWVALCFVSHKVLRTLAPLLMLTLLAATAWLPAPWAAAGVALQLAFYASAAAGWICQRRGRMITWLSVPLYFCLGNLAMLAGLTKFFSGRCSPVWERSR